MSKLMFSATKLPMLGKQGKIEPDADGYYELVVGGLNTHNNAGSWYYTAEGCRQLFGPGSIIHRRIANGCLKAEVNHPRQMPGESREAFFNRMMDIDLNNVCAHFKEIWLDENYGKNNPHAKNPNLIAIMAKVKPSGAKGHLLKEALQNQSENVCFSIRAIADEGYVRGKVVRVLKDIVAIDLVNEGGIVVASKWDSPATESFDHTEILMRLDKTFVNRATTKESMDVFATESSREMVSFVAQKYFQEPNNKPVYTRW